MALRPDHPAFLIGGGDVGARMRAHDWSSSTLGAPATWPQSLRSVVGLLLGSKFPMFVAWGRDLGFLYNDAYAEILGAKHPQALGAPFQKVWSEIWSDISPLIDGALAGEASYHENLPLVMNRKGFDEQTWFTFSYSPVRDESGAVAGMYCAVAETTAQVLAERRQAFQLQLSERLARVSRPGEVMEVAVEALGRHLGASRVGYCEVRADGELIDFRACFSDGVAPIVGTYRLEDFGPERIARQRRGETEIVADVRDGDAPAEETWAAIETRAVVSVPLVRDGVFRASIYVNHREPHAWTADEVSLIEDVAARTWAAVEQARAEAALRRSEEQLRLATEAAEVGPWDLDPLSDTLFWPPRVKAMFGISADRSITMADFYDGLHPDDAQATRTAFAAAMDPAQRAFYDVEYRTIGKEDQVVRWVAAKGRGIFDEDGRCTRVIGTAIDITARKRDEEQLRQLNAELERKVTERALGRSRTWQLTPDLMGVLNGQGYFEQSNPAWEAVLGWTEAEVASLPFLHLIHPEDLARTQAAFEDVFERGLPVIGLENRYRSKAGGWRWLSWMAVPEEGKTYCSARDITEDKARAADLLLHSNIVQSHRSPVLAFDRDLRVTAFNQAHRRDFLRVLGREAAIGEVFPALFPPEQGDALSVHMQRALRGESFTIVEEFGDPDLAKPAWEVSYYPLRDESERIIGAFHHANDISGRLRAEAELQAARDALRQSQKMEAMGQLTGGVAHDFNNLLTPIVGSLDMLQRRGIGGEREQRLISGAMQSAERAKVLVQRLLAFARRQPLQPVPIDVGKLVTGMGDLVASTTGPQIKVIVEAPAGLPAALADPNQVEMALLNLCVNARDAMADTGTLRISAGAEAVGAGHRSGLPRGDYICLSVADTGSGMDAETLARAVEPFFSTKGVGKGTGLGLSMVHGLALQLGGALTIQSQPGLGANVELWLPQSAAALPQTDRREREAELGPDVRGVALLVDDEELVRSSTADMLAELGYAVIESGSAEDALRRVAKGERFDLLVTDHLMPGMNGTELAREVRTARPDLPVLLVSGYAQGDGIEPDLPRLAKPFRKHELASSLAQILATADS